ncbi:PAS domain-containing protein [Kaistia granuli]|uniref:PAS domain-containing protein n=1 Tax=Kaistia granuli TaxID=363259 RepID=UPI00037D0287|nr:PAS domain S-box protein [Kaistia granuli]
MNPETLEAPDTLRSALAGALLDSIADAIVATDREGRITFWNPGAARIFGFDAAEAVGQSLDLIIPENQRARHWQGYDTVMRTGQSRYVAGDLLAVPALAADGRRISVEFTIVLLRDGEGGVTGMAAVMRDVTERFETIKVLRRQLAAQRPEVLGS